MSKGIPASNVPAGQINLQNQGFPIPHWSVNSSGNATTRSNSTKYLIYFHVWGIAIFFPDGILCNNSCNKPKGQSQPHVNLPVSDPIIPMVPKTEAPK
jgi:hypothetical protein